MSTTDNGGTEPQHPTSAGPAGTERTEPTGADAVPRPANGGHPPLPLPAREEPAQPFSAEEYAGLFLRPQRSIEYILGSRERLSRSVWDGRHVWRLAAMLLAASLLAAIPYGIVAPRGNWWTIAVLFCGSLMICFPSLHTFAQFCGLRLDLGRNFALSLIITATASLFTFGFFPIIWFIQFSIAPAQATIVAPRDLSDLLLWISMLLGLVQIGRCLAGRDSRSRRQASIGLLFLLWAPLLIFITYRMALLLEAL